MNGCFHVFIVTLFRGITPVFKFLVYNIFTKNSQCYASDEHAGVEVGVEMRQCKIPPSHAIAPCTPRWYGA
jgi:hypothetical protein